MIVNVNIRRCENGWFVNYQQDGKWHDRVFLVWGLLCDWLKEQAETP